ncbi:hypothetical protein DSO57_1035212 [Entomophthora muscae]|uniref:Uncharacterized protein n=1 Tax=Entomophthora muscae TaxID=34485 RepID=A0ACC2RQH5_9FUNG|nr:hypothetical protein DSO57_1035212 [Entomophthora muscae]
MVPQINAQFTLPKEISVSAFTHPHAAYAAKFGKPISNIVLDKNDITPLYVKSPTLPANVDAKAGDILLGKLSLSTGPKLGSPPKVGFVLAPKPDFAKDDDTPKEEVPSDKDSLEAATIKAKLTAVLKSKDKEWKLTQLQAILSSAESIKWDSESQAQLVMLGLINRQLVTLLDLAGCTSLPDFSQSYHEHVSKLITKAHASVNDGQVRDFFAQPQPAPKQMAIMKASREASSIAHLAKLIQALVGPNKPSPQDLDSLFNSMEAHAATLPSDHEHLYFLTQVAYFEEKNWKGRALKRLNTYLETEFFYATKDRQRLESILKIRYELVKALGFIEVWGSYLDNYRLKALPRPDHLVLG